MSVIILDDFGEKINVKGGIVKIMENEILNMDEPLHGDG